MAEPFAIVNDLEARWRELDEQEQARAAVLLVDASNYIRVLANDDFSEASEETLEVLKAVTCDIVKRAMLSDINDGAISSIQQTAGSYSESLNYANPTGDIYLTSLEKKLLGISSQTISFSVPEIGGDY